MLSNSAPDRTINFNPSSYDFVQRAREKTSPALASTEEKANLLHDPWMVGCHEAISLDVFSFDCLSTRVVYSRRILPQTLIFVNT